MKLTGLRLIAISSALLAASATAATRPHYGGTLHVQMESTLSSLDPAGSQTNPVGTRSVLGLIFDTLVALNNRGEPEPRLAISWQVQPGNEVWQFTVRPGVMFSDGTAMTPEIVAGSLRRANPNWKIIPQENGIVIQLDAASNSLPAELALLRNSIVKIESGKVFGTGAFFPGEWTPGRKLVVTARDDYWDGRPFLDSVEIELGKNFRDEMIAYQLGQSQLIEIPSEQAQHATEAREIRASQPVELIALLFARDVQSPDEAKQRHALALSIDGDQLNRVVLQNGGEATGGILPDWLSGYGFLFPHGADLPRAQQLRAEVPMSHVWTLGFDVNDPLARVLAERVALNAGDAGLRVQLSSNQSMTDVRLVRISLASVDPYVALAEMAKSMQLTAPKFLGNTVDDLYHAENAVLQSQRVIPLLYLRTAWAVSKSVRNWEPAGDGSWRMPEVWLAPGKP